MQIPDKKDEVVQNTLDVVTVDQKKLDELKVLAMKNSRKRIRLNLHTELESPLHEMLIIHTKDNYVRPHKHFQKSESFHLVEGEMIVLIFNDEGKITQVIPMGAPATGKCFLYRVNPEVWHSVLPVSDFIVFHETTRGPFNPANTAFPQWAPDESDPRKAQDYVDSLWRSLKQ